eukprot:XP_001694772.1 predicted protein [Chlamydomonas reinhardtii]
MALFSWARWISCSWGECWFTATAAESRSLPPTGHEQHPCGRGGWRHARPSPPQPQMIIYEVGFDFVLRANRGEAEARHRPSRPCSRPQSPTATQDAKIQLGPSPWVAALEARRLRSELAGTLRRYYIAPVIAVLLMLACTCMTIQDVGRGLLGNDQIKPYGILILFMSMAYIAESLDATGIFAWMALKFTVLSGGRGFVLFLFYFLLSSFITTFTSNDVCILTLTPIVCYFAKATGADPMPFLFAEYAAANTFGALLYTGNPTNIIVAQAYDMTFLGYSKYMTLPTFAAGVVTFLVLLLEFRSSIPRRIPLPAVDASHMVRDRLGAVFGSVNMLTCLSLLAAAPTLGWELWAITLVCGGVHAVYNLWPFRASLPHLHASRSVRRKQAIASSGNGNTGGAVDDPLVAPLINMPAVVPFTLGMFVLVEGLSVQGWLAVFGSGLGDACRTLPAAVFIIGFLSVFLANTINNQPMTILLTRVLLSEQFTSRVGYGNTHMASLFALVLASNIGAVFTLIGALAGILWSNILGLHGLRCSYLRFLRVCFPVGFASLVAGLAVLWFEFGVFPHS